MCIVVLWLGRTLTDTDTYVSKVSPLVSNQDVQDFAVEQVTKGLLEADDAPVKDVATKLLGAKAVKGLNTEQLRAAVEPAVENTIRKVVSSPEFAQLWEDTNRTVHTRLIQELENEGATVTLDFRPLLNGVVGQLNGTNLEFAQKDIKIEKNAGVVTVTGTDIQNARDAYDNFKRSEVLIVALALVMSVLTIAISTHRLKAAQRLLLVVGVMTAILAAGLGLIGQMEPTGSGEREQRMALAVFDQLTGDLRTSFLTVAGVCLVAAASGKAFEIIRRRRSGAKTAKTPKK